MKALVVAGGTEPSASLLQARAQQADILIAADRGLDVCTAYGIQPDILVGDFDSAAPESLKKAAETAGEIYTAPSEKDETDLELAARIAAARGAGNICILGALGGRTDHLLGNLAVLLHLHRIGSDAVIEDEHESIRVVEGPYRFTGFPGQTVSLMPAAGDVTVSAQGLYYPLENLRLAKDGARGISNRITEGEVVLHSSGPVFLLCSKESA